MSSAGPILKSSSFPGSVRRALIVLTCVALIPVAAMQAWIYYTWFQVRVSEEIRVDLEVARSVGFSFQAFLDDVTRQEFAMGLAISALHPYAAGEASRFLQASRALYPAVRAFRWANTAGRVIASSDERSIGIDIGDRQYFREILAGNDVVVSNQLVDRASGERVVIIARAIRDEQGAALGTALALVDSEKLGGTVIPVRQPEGGLVALFDRAGELVFHRPATAAVPSNWLKSDPLLAQALSGREVTGKIVSPIDGSNSIAARVPLNSIGWVAGASRPERLMLAPIVRNLLFNTGMLLVVVCISFMLAYGITGMIIRALGRLKHHAAAVGEGQLEHRAEVAGFVELSELADSFNRMAAQLLARRRAEEAATAELTRANKELDAFAYSVSHDLRSPLRSIDGFSQAMLEDYDERLDDQGREYLRRVRAASQRMGQLIDDLLKLSRVARTEMRRETVDLSRLAEEVAADLKMRQPDRAVEVIIQPGLAAQGDAPLLRVALENLLGNAWKFTQNAAQARIEVGAAALEGRTTYFVRDNGAGFDMTYAGRLFGAFQRLHTNTEFPGTGIGLATVQRIVHRHGGTVRAEGEVGKGAAFYFTL